MNMWHVMSTHRQYKWQHWKAMETVTAETGITDNTKQPDTYTPCTKHASCFQWWFDYATNNTRFNTDSQCLNHWAHRPASLFTVSHRTWCKCQQLQLVRERENHQTCRKTKITGPWSAMAGGWLTSSQWASLSSLTATLSCLTVCKCDTDMELPQNRHHSSPPDLQQSLKWFHQWTTEQWPHGLKPIIA